ncbi:unnamed protein product, partial [Mycena citricolor]
RRCSTHPSHTSCSRPPTHKRPKSTSLDQAGRRPDVCAANIDPAIKSFYHLFDISFLPSSPARRPSPVMASSLAETRKNTSHANVCSDPSCPVGLFHALETPLLSQILSVSFDSISSRGLLYITLSACLGRDPILWQSTTCIWVDSRRSG